MKFKLTEKNAANVMQIINTFFKKDSFELVKDVERVKFDPSGEYMNPVYVVQDEYTPMIDVTCIKHPMANEKQLYSPAETLKRVPVLLFICSKYLHSGIPLYLDDVVINKGSRLVIKKANRYFRVKNGRQYFQVEWVQRTFIQNHIEDEVREKFMKESFNGMIIDEIVSDYESIQIFELDEKYHINGSSIQECYNEIEHKLSEILHHPDFVETSLIFETDKYRIYLNRNLSSFKKNGVQRVEEDSFFYTIVNEKETIVLKDKRLERVLLEIATSYSPEGQELQPDFEFDFE